jgi:hypothetical protein
MSFISPALISRIFQALGQNKGSHAILLLRQHKFEKEAKHDKELMPLVVQTADQCLFERDLERAEDHYKLGLALYSTCFRENHVDALRCMSGLCSIYEKLERQSDLAAVVGQLEEVTNAVRTNHGGLRVAV